MSDPILFSLGDVTIRKSDAELLRDGVWLNDNCITFFYEYLESEVYAGNEEVLFVHPGTMFLLRMFSDASDVERTVKHLHLHKRSVIFMPINDSDGDTSSGSHWGLLVYDRKSNQFRYYDSMGQGNLRYAKESFRQLASLVGAPSKPQFVHIEDAPHQINSYDCGVYVLCNTEYLAEHYTDSEYSSDEHHQAVNPEKVTQMRRRLQELVKEQQRKRAAQS